MENNMEMQKNDFHLRFKEGVVKDFEKVVLSSGTCDLFMPMGFVSSGEDGELVSYDCSGYTALRHCKVTEAREALDILEKTFMAVSRAGEYLLTPGKITLSLDTIFYDRRTRKVKIAYVPVDTGRMNLRENMSGFLTQMEKKTPGKGGIYIKALKSQMEEKNYYIRDMINLIGEIKRRLKTTR